MKKTTKIIYWVATLWLSLGMVSTGLIQLLKTEEEVNNITKLGYPGYLLPLLGVLKILGVVVVLVPRFTLLKEWAYAGFFFAMAGAAFSRIAAGDGMAGFAPPLLLLFLTVASWYFRPVNRKVISFSISQ